MMMRVLGDGREEFLRQIESGIRSCRDKLAVLEARSRNASQTMGRHYFEIVPQLRRKGANLETQIRDAWRMEAAAFKAKKEMLRASWNSYRNAVNNLDQVCRASA